MSCILVAIFSSLFDPDQLDSFGFASLITRDVVLLVFHLTLIAIFSKDSCVTKGSSVLGWILADCMATFLRLIRTLLWYIVRVHYHHINGELPPRRSSLRERSQYQNQSVPSIPMISLVSDVPLGVRPMNIEITPFSASLPQSNQQQESSTPNSNVTGIWKCMCVFFGPKSVSPYSMTVWVTLDWLTYLIWMIGLWVVHPSVECTQRNLLATVVFFEIMISASLVCLSIVLITCVYILNKGTQGFCFPGMVVTSREWPGSCPILYIDTSQWQKRGESVVHYRTRRRREFEAMEDPTQQLFMTRQNNAETITIPAPRETPLPRLSAQELEQLRTFSFDPHDFDVPEIPKQISSNDRIVLALEELHLDKDPSTDSYPSPALSKKTMTSNETCALCLSDYELGDRLRQLNCEHCFHTACVDEWLLENKRTCPICNADASHTGSEHLTNI